MRSLVGEIQEVVASSFYSIPGVLQDEEIVVELSSQEQFGHYQCSAALKLAKKLQKSPRVIAEGACNLLIQKHQSLFDKVEVAGAGFINLTLSSRVLIEKVLEMIADPFLGVERANPPEKIIVEFSSPNTAKELHVGHLRSTIIGDSLARVFEFLGHQVVRLNHVGDWGTQFGMLIVYMQKNVPEVLLGKQEALLSDLMQWYRLSKLEFDQDAEFKKKAQRAVVLLQNGDPEILAAWRKICDISRKGYQEIYDLLGIKIQERGESFYNPFLPGIVSDLEKKGLVTLSEGAKCIYLDGFVGESGAPLPMIIQKTDGGFNYDTTDMAALVHRIQEEKSNRIFMVVDAGQSLHFQMLLKAAEKAGYWDPAKVDVRHVAFGVVLGEDGKKFKTRSGNTEKLIDLLKEAIARAKAILEQKLPDLAPDVLQKMSKILGIDSVKYADLSCHRIRDYSFSYDRMLRFEGNTAPFLLYAYVRSQSILRRVGKEVRVREGVLSLQTAAEQVLAFHLIQFPEVLLDVSKTLLPNHLTDYLYKLAEKFHLFFRDCKVEGSDQEEGRLWLCHLTSGVLRKGLELLGLEVLERM